MVSARVLICATLSASTCCLKKVYETSTRWGWPGMNNWMSRKLANSTAAKNSNRHHRLIGAGAAEPVGREAPSGFAPLRGCDSPGISGRHRGRRTHTTYLATMQGGSTTVGLRWSLVACSMTDSTPRHMTIRHRRSLKGPGSAATIGTRRGDADQQVPFATGQQRRCAGSVSR